MIRVWLLELVTGRFRLLSDSEAEQDPKLGEIRAAIVDGPGEVDAAATQFESSEMAARLGRLIPATLSPPRPSWRLTLPKRMILQEDNKNLVLLFSLGYLEIWLPRVYQAALSSRIDQVI